MSVYQALTAINVLKRQQLDSNSPIAFTFTHLVLAFYLVSSNIQLKYFRNVTIQHLPYSEWFFPYMPCSFVGVFFNFIEWNCAQQYEWVGWGKRISQELYLLIFWKALGSSSYCGFLFVVGNSLLEGWWVQTFSENAVSTAVVELQEEGGQVQGSLVGAQDTFGKTVAS